MRRQEPRRAVLGVPVRRPVRPGSGWPRTVEGGHQGPPLDQRVALALRHGVGNQVIQRLLSRGSSAPVAIQRMSVDEYQDLERTFGGDVKTACAILSTSLSAWTSLPKERVVEMIKLLRRDPDRAYQAAFQPRIGFPPGARIAERTLSGANCHAYALNGDFTSEDVADPPDMGGYRPRQPGDARPIFAFFRSRGEIAHSAVLRDGYGDFRHKFIDLPVIECAPEVAASTYGYGEWGLFVPRDRPPPAPEQRQPVRLVAGMTKAARLLAAARREGK